MAKIWIDLDNAPHVPFFAPIVRRMRENGHVVEITLRDYGFTGELLAQHGLEGRVVGRHPGRNMLRKIFGLSFRAISLAWWARRRHFDVAVSHGSRGLCLASWLVRVPSVTIYDYEFVSTFIFNRLSRRVMLPEMLPDARIRSLGLGVEKVIKYPGLKEEVYLGAFVPNGSILSDLGATNGTVVVVVRPPATGAHYHNPESEVIVEAVLERIRKDPAVTAVIVPRTQNEAGRFEKRWANAENIRVLRRAVDGLNLIWHADLVVGGGGTMNREAALLGVPVYSVFMGKAGAIDSALCEQGKLHFVRASREANEVPLVKRERPPDDAERAQRAKRSEVLIDFIAAEIEAVVRRPRSK